MRLIWSNVFIDVVLDPERNLYYVTCPGGYMKGGYLLPGTYQVDIQSGAYKPVIDLLTDLTYLGGDSFSDRFVGLDAYGTVRYFDPQGGMTVGEKEGWERLFPSPDKQMFVLTGPQGVRLDYWEDQPPYEVWIVKKPITALQWSPDSEFIAYELDKRINLSDLDGNVVFWIDNPKSLPWQWISSP
jgi:hypothetical protein